MTDMLTERLNGPEAWRARDIAADEDWVLNLTEDHFADFDRALANVRDLGRDLESVRRGDVPLPSLEDDIATMKHELEHGRGFKLIRGLPVHTRYTEQETSIIYWAIGQHLGRAVPQNDRGHLLGHIVDKRELGESIDPHRRPYEGAGAFNFHCDQGDVVGLLCLRKAVSGGESLIVSAAEVHNVMLDERADLLAELYGTFQMDRKKEEVPGALPYYPIQVFSYLDQKLSIHLAASLIIDAQRFPEVPRLTATQLEAFEFAKSVANRPGMFVEMMMEEGDMQFLLNFNVLHGRRSYVDHDEYELRRHMLRLWLAFEGGGRRLPPDVDAMRFGVPQRSPEAADDLV
jgi:hypothetical protein